MAAARALRTVVAFALCALAKGLVLSPVALRVAACRAPPPMMEDGPCAGLETTLPLTVLCCWSYRRRGFDPARVRHTDEGHLQMVQRGEGMCVAAPPPTGALRGNRRL